ncbi:ABC transporter ATP-binding protein [Paenibacillus sp. SYP-B3998]|uniref:ABC transporter ATP-binding protein n=1 Tax=Paenibacillus sp. SYP-B3998 TaxID=2678564 RepID=A0A6G4A6C9_9BACL|nr:ABC transporter ATP-binding protein [Paenibacillus sp. SYP-B3998]NEW09381.1 ABC transporter ATP-binding protein [Paenibacillus sp. SYP-B3998]
MRDLRWFFAFLKQVKGLYAISMLLLVVSVVAYILITAVQRTMIDTVFQQGQYDRFKEVLVLFIASAIVYVGSWVAKDMFFERTSTKLSILMRESFMRKLHRMPTATFQNERIGSISSRMEQFLRSRDFFTNHLPYGIENGLNMFILMVIVGSANVWLLVSISLLSLFYIWLSKRYVPKMSKVAKDIQSCHSEIGTHIEEGISSTREVVAYHRNAWEAEKIDAGFQNYLKKMLEQAKLKNKQSFFTDPFRWGAVLLILGFGGYSVIQGRMTIGTFVIVYQFTNQLMDAYQGVYNFIIRFAESKATVERAGEWLHGDQLTEGTRAISGAIVQLSFCDVHFQYSEDRGMVLKGLTMDLPIGQKIAIVGASGAGKSTVAQLLARLYEPGQGYIEVNSMSMDTYNRETWLSRMSVVFQDPYLLPETVRMNVTLGREVQEHEVIEACRIAQIHDTILMLPDGYETVLGERGITLSGGQRQRLALARAILINPELLILDEASSALDLETERRVMHELDVLRQGKTTIFIAHRLSTVENADLIVVMEDGQVAEMGTHRELLGAGGVYAGLIQVERVFG